MQWSIYLKEKLFSCSLNTQYIFILFDLQCFFLKCESQKKKKKCDSPNRKTTYKMWTSGFSWPRRAGRCWDSTSARQVSAFCLGHLLSSSPLLSLTWLVTVLSLKKQAPKIKSSSEIVQKRKHLKMIPNILWYIRARHPWNASHVLCSGPPKTIQVNDMILRVTLAAKKNCCIGRAYTGSVVRCEEMKPVNPKGNQSWIFIGRTDTEAPVLWPPDAKSQLSGKDPDAGK